MKVDIVIGNVVWEAVSCYCPQAGRSVNEKEEFYDLMDKIVTSEVLVGGDSSALLVVMWVVSGRLMGVAGLGK